ncbi:MULTISPECIES: hypothetical protein [Sporomusa]|uniref:hypothetical protein n=1 Tax=Sporomusa TaxID=2375 RepID=UPI00202FEF36|nr:hypothetical protein [Sporomusa sphaeroides]MCM0756968.1 hypothetical protein [Sporomusa sphaeroides DSM 2875]
MTKNNKNNTVFVQVVERPDRKLILRRGIKADNYFDYCKEVGCEVWGILCSIKEALYEPIGMRLPENLCTPGTSVYAQGVEVPVNYTGTVPGDFEIIGLNPCEYMVNQGPPFANEEFVEAIHDLWQIMRDYNAELYVLPGLIQMDQDSNLNLREKEAILKLGR